MRGWKEEFGQIIGICPAAPGTRVITALENSDGDMRPEFEPILLFGIVRDDDGDRIEPFVDSLDGTFEEYLQERWDMGRAHAYRLISATQTVENLSPIGDIPTTESQVRELSGLSPEEQRKTWERALETAPDNKPTAAHIRQAAYEFGGKHKYSSDCLERREEIDRLRREADKLLSVKTKASSRRAQRLLKNAQPSAFHWVRIPAPFSRLRAALQD